MRTIILAFCLMFASVLAKAQPYQFEATPSFDHCGDSSLLKAQKDGITLGISPSPPYSYINPKTGKAGGIDVEINDAVLHWLGITKIHYSVAPFGQLIPALLAHRIDVIAANIHITPDRIKVISFTGPAWWYGPAIVVRKGNPEHLTSFAMLKGKKIGAIAGSAADEYLRHIGAHVVPFSTDAEEFAAISTGRVQALVEDDVKTIGFMKANPNAPIEIVPNVAVPTDLIFKYGYGYARYGIRKQDCTLRAGYTQGLAEVRGVGEVSAILKKYGLSNRNFVFFPLQ
ncbi:MAG: transporter substrate-binding domain-containing protein [Rhodospirillales bacterium]|nr:transporter substrate-binding domain-containing protein [Rhodospirillales bacterium]